MSLRRRFRRALLAHRRRARVEAVIRALGRLQPMEGVALCGIHIGSTYDGHRECCVAREMARLQPIERQYLQRLLDAAKEFHDAIPGEDL